MSLDEIAPLTLLISLLVHKESSPLTKFVKLHNSFLLICYAMSIGICKFIIEKLESHSSPQIFPGQYIA